MNRNIELLSALYNALLTIVADSDLMTKWENGNVILQRKELSPGKSVAVAVVASTPGNGTIKIDRVLVEKNKPHKTFESYNSPASCNLDEAISWCLGIMPSIIAREPDTDELGIIGFRQDVPEGIGFGR